jgi:serine/threonine-protein kinase
MADTLDGPAEGWGGRLIADRYHVERNIGAGAGGAVYLAFDTVAQKLVAMKFLHPWLLDSVDAVDRFQAEAAAQAALNHPNIVRVLDVGEYKGHRFLTMEYADGGSLSGSLDARGSMSVRAALQLFIPLIRGVGAAHERGIIHRDIKPSNVLLSRHGDRVVARLTDFGVAKWCERAGDTATGAVIGTAMYMAPEQFGASSRVDGRADIYALGATLYQALCGKLTKQPAWAQKALPVLHEVMPGAPPSVSHAITKAMRMDPAQRFRCCEEMAAELESALSRSSVG